MHQYNVNVNDYGTVWSGGKALDLQSIGRGFNYHWD